MARLIKPFSQQSLIQKLGLVVTAIAAIIIAFLHNPLDGYRIQKVVNRSQVVMKDCSKEKLKEYYDLVRAPNDMTPQSIARGFRRNELANECFELETHYDDEMLPFSEWSSSNPIVAWLGPIVHLLGALVALGAIALVWLVAFETRPLQRDETKP